MATKINLSSNETIQCHYTSNSPLIVTPSTSRSDINFIQWAKAHQEAITTTIQSVGGVIFRGFNLTQEDFSEAFTASTGLEPQSYKGDTPREEISTNIYKSTAVAKGHKIPLHQECSATNRRDMPKYISFLCVTPPEMGTGQTLTGDAKCISVVIHSLMPDLWEKLTTKTLTYTARYLPKNEWRTSWIRWFNPSHATIEKRFGTEVKEEVEHKCKEEGLTCTWDGGWAVVSKKEIPATLDVKGDTLFCNQIHLDKFNPALCGGWFNYYMARMLLYPNSRWTQFDVQFDDGTQITSEEASRLLTILGKNQTGQNWEKGDLMLLDNAATLHGKTPHKGKREILVAMSGSVEND